MSINKFSFSHHNTNTNPIFKQVEDALHALDTLHDFDEDMYFHTLHQEDPRSARLTLSYEPNLDQIRLMLQTISSFEGVAGEFIPATVKLTLFRGVVAPFRLTEPQLRLYMTTPVEAKDNGVRWEDIIVIEKGW